MTARRWFPRVSLATAVLLPLALAVVGFTGCSKDSGGTGPLPQPQCELSTTALNLGSVTVGACGPTTSFTIKNAGNGTLEGSVAEQCDDFAITDGSGAFSLGKDATRTVTIQFCPTSVGNKTCAIATGVAECASVTCVGVAVATIPAPTRACCQPGGTCTVTAETSCQAPNVWHPEWTACQPNNCPAPLPTAACCSPITGACMVTTQASCPAPNVWHANWASCQPNDCPAPPPPPAAAACCSPTSGTCTLTFQAACQNPNVWHADWASCDPTNPCPPPTGACCGTASGACSITTQVACGFTWLGVAVLCDAQTCPVPALTGACCNSATGDCTITTQAACALTWLGSGTICNAQTCPVPPPTGACCNIATGACTITIQTACASTWLGSGTICNAQTCPVPALTGACCNSATGDCTITTQAACALTWLGSGTICNAQTCPVPPPTGACCAFNYLSWSCTILTLAQCEQVPYPVEWKGADTTCNPSPCGPTGACCNTTSGACTISIQAACTFDWLGAGTICDAQTCPVPPPTGACCNTASGACSITTQAACQLSWLGADVSCNTTTCAAPVANGMISIHNETDFYIIDIRINGISVSTIQPGQGYGCNAVVPDQFAVAPGTVSVYVAIGTWIGDTRDIFYDFGPANYTVSPGATTSLTVTKKRVRILANENDASGQWFTGTDFCGGLLYEMAYHFTTNGNVTLSGHYPNAQQYGIQQSSGFVDGWNNLNGNNTCTSAFCSPGRDFLFCIHNTSSTSLPSHPVRLGYIYGSQISDTWGGTIYVSMGCSTGTSTVAFFAVSSKPSWVP